MNKDCFTSALCTVFLLLWTMLPSSQATAATRLPNISTQTHSNSVAGPQRLKRILYADGSSRQFTYDASGKLIGETFLERNHQESDRIQHSFGSNGKLATYSVRYKQPETPWNQGYVEEFLYNATGELSSKKRYALCQGDHPEQPVRSLALTDSLIYNSIGQIVGRRTYSYVGTRSHYSQTPVTLTTTTYRYNSKNNLVEETAVKSMLASQVNFSTQVTRIEYVYDDKINPYYQPKNPVFDQIGWSKNNLIQSKTYSSNTSNRADLQTTKPIISTYRYVYKNDLPISRFPENSSSPIEQYEYEQ